MGMSEELFIYGDMDNLVILWKNFILICIIARLFREFFFLGDIC